MAELADAQHLGCCAERLEGSSPSSRTPRAGTPLALLPTRRPSRRRYTMEEPPLFGAPQPFPGLCPSPGGGRECQTMLHSCYRAWPGDRTGAGLLADGATFVLQVRLPALHFPQRRRPARGCLAGREVLSSTRRATTLAWPRLGMLTHRRGIFYCKVPPTGPAGWLL